MTPALMPGDRVLVRRGAGDRLQVGSTTRLGVAAGTGAMPKRTALHHPSAQHATQESEDGPVKNALLDRSH
jgi:hypothetical protein